jgi:hypothetical protein
VEEEAASTIGPAPTRFLIFSLSRSGSSSLRDILDCHPQVRCAFEPFNPSTRLGEKYGRSITDEATLEQALARVWEGYSGIKHVWNYNRLPFGAADNQRLNRHLLAVCNARVIYLKRRNVLRRIVSAEISHQSQQWSSNARARWQVRRSKFEPLDISWLRWQLEHEHAAIESFRGCLVRAQIPFFDLWYEDLFGEFDPPEGCLDKVQEIFSFLGLPELDAKRWTRAEGMLDPLQRRVNSKDSYDLIPNIREVEDLLGTDETGWLFR